jgi:hypothetical protein
MSGSGLNHNMNAHVGNRITSRVLQPPGGASSFSLGSDPAPYRAPQRQQTKENYSNFRNQFDDNLSGGYQKPRGSNEVVHSRKSRQQDDITPNIGSAPVAKSYNDSSRSNYGRNMPPTTMRNDDYAEMLRQQIEDNKNYHSGEKITSNNSGNSNQQYHNSRENSRDNYDSSINNRRRSNAGGGRSTLSLSWE